jgi:hypothetical protein
VEDDASSSREVEDELETPASAETVDYAEREDEWAEYAYVATMNPHDEDHPTSEETLNCWDSDWWSITRDEEIEMVRLFKTFKLAKLPPGFKLLKSWWVNVVKCNQDGEQVRYRARLVVKGLGQQFRIDYGEVFAHVLHTDTLCLLFTLAMIHDWDMWSLDIVSAFLKGQVEEEIYMEQIPGYEDGTERVLWIVRSLYGLKQAPCIWNKTFAQKVLAISYKWTAANPSLFFQEQNGKTSILAVYVDDIVIFVTCGFAKEVVKELMKVFEMRDLGELKDFLGYKITRNHQEMTITISQEKYLQNILEQAGLSNANPVKLPMVAGTQQQRYSSDHLDVPYATRIGELLYAVLGTWPDIAFAVQHLSQFSTNPGPEHVASVKKVYWYLKGTISFGITYRGRNAIPEALGYCNADWGQNLLDWKSITGMVFILAGGAVSWTSKKQAAVALSTLEAEYLALSLAVRHSIWIHQFYLDLKLMTNYPLTLKTHIDNQAAITLANNPLHHACSKLFDVWHHFICNMVDAHQVSIHKICSKGNPADLLTKALPGPRSMWLWSMAGQQ